MLQLDSNRFQNSTSNPFGTDFIAPSSFRFETEKDVEGAIVLESDVGLQVPTSFAYPREHMDITKAHLRFRPWAESGGAQYVGWYEEKPGYRNMLAIY